MADLVRTKPNRPWVLKMGLFLVLLIAGGSWFLYDATIKYPARGWLDASYRLWVYLDAADSAGQLTIRNVSVDDPHAEYDRLTEKRAQNQTLSPQESARLEWLRALLAVGALSPEMVQQQLVDDPDTETVTETPRQRLAELREFWQGESAPQNPKPLATWDISVQWGIAIFCYVLAVLLILHMLRVLAVRYGWEADEKRLHLPGGATLVPSDLEDVDKRLWHKFIVFLKVKDEHDTLGGKEIKLDLYQHAGLEGWVLEMERTAFPDRVEAEKEPEAAESTESAPVESE